eukprot:14556443-Heterocapsa_arctica.AAC.1
MNSELERPILSLNNRDQLTAHRGTRKRQYSGIMLPRTCVPFCSSCCRSRYSASRGNERDACVPVFVANSPCRSAV